MPRWSELSMPPSPKPDASTSPSTTPATTSRGWRKLSPPNKRSVSWTRIFLARVAIYANRAKKIRVHETLRLFGGDSFLQPREVGAGVVDGDVDASCFGDRKSVV